MQLSTLVPSSGLRRATVGAAVLLLACAPLVACSQGSDDASGIPTFDPEAMASAKASESAAAAAASASAAASAEAAGVVTAESLSTDRYVVTSIPEDLDEQQTEVLKAFINYDQVTWNIWFTGTGVESAESLVTDEGYEKIRASYEALEGGRIDGNLRVSIDEVFVLSGMEAQILMCGDRSDLVRRDADGNDITDPESLRGRYEVLVTMTNDDGMGWVTSNEDTLTTNECTV